MGSTFNSNWAENHLFKACNTAKSIICNLLWLLFDAAFIKNIKLKTQESSSRNAYNKNIGNMLAEKTPNCLSFQLSALNVIPLKPFNLQIASFDLSAFLNSFT